MSYVAHGSLMHPMAAMATVNDVGRFLRAALPASIATGAAAAAIDQDVDGEVLRSMTETEYEQVLGIAAFGHRRKLTLLLRRYQHQRSESAWLAHPAGVESQRAGVLGSRPAAEPSGAGSGTAAVDTGATSAAGRAGDHRPRSDDSPKRPQPKAGSGSASERATEPTARGLFDLYAGGRGLLHRQQYQRYLEDVGQSIGELEPSSDESGDSDSDTAPQDWWTLQRAMLVNSLPEELRGE